jgi:phage tail P2-like protein
MSTPSLLPPNATVLERRIAASGFVTPSGRVPTLWNADTCPAALLPWLAWAESVDEWDDTWAEQRKRDVIKASRAIHRMKGTPAAIRRALAALGQPDAELIERFDLWRRDGTSTRNAVRQHGGGQDWAVFKVILQRPITQDQATLLQRSIAAVTRNCCHLVGFDYKQAALRHNKQATRNGSYTRGLINI